MAEQHLTPGTIRDTRMATEPRPVSSVRGLSRMSRGRWIALSAAVLVILALVGVGVWYEVSKDISHGPNQFVGASGSLKSGHMHYHYGTFNGLAREQTAVTAGQTITVDYTLHATKGSLAVEVVDPAGNVMWNLGVPQNQDLNGTKTIPVAVDGKYQVVLIGLNTGGNFDVSWSAK